MPAARMAVSACVLGATVDRLLTSPRTGTVAAELQPVAAALKSMTRANSGLTWINQRHVQAFLAELAARPAITHDILDHCPLPSMARCASWPAPPRTAGPRRTPTARGSSAATSPDSTSPPRAYGNGSPACSPPARPGWELCTN